MSLFEAPELDAPRQSRSRYLMRQQGLSIPAPPEIESPAEDTGEAPLWMQVLQNPVFRGIEGLANSLYNLADVATGDILWDWDSEDRLLGKSETFVGSMLEGITQFVIPFGFSARFIAKGAKIPFTSKSVAGLDRLSKSAQVAARERAAAAAAAGAAAKLAGKILPAGAGRELGRFMVAGGIADFAAFQGHEHRLSNLIETFPDLQNPITDYLQATGDEDSIQGRLKNVLEGLGIGAMVDGFVHTLRALKRARATGSDDALGEIDAERVRSSVRARHDEALIEAIDDSPSPARWVADNIGENELPVVAQGEKANSRVVTVAGQELRIERRDGMWHDSATGRELGATLGEVESKLRGPDIFKTAEIKVAIDTPKESKSVFEGKVGDAPFKLSRKKQSEPWTGTVGGEEVSIKRRKVGTIHEWVDTKTGMPLGPTKSDAMKAIHRRRRLADAGETIQQNADRELPLIGTDVLQRVAKLTKEKLDKGTVTGNVRDLTPGEALYEGLKIAGPDGSDVNLTRLDKSPRAVARAVAEMMPEARHPKQAKPVSDREFEERVLTRVNEILGVVPREAASEPPVPLGLLVDQHLKEGERFAEMAQGFFVVLRQASDRATEMAARAVKAADGPSQIEALSEFGEAFNYMVETLRAVKGGDAIKGRALRANRLDLRGVDRMIAQLGDLAARKPLLETAQKLTKMAEEGNIAGGYKLAEAMSQTSLFKIGLEYWMNAILSGGKTLFVNLTSGIMLSTYRPLERLIGSTRADFDVNVRLTLLEYKKLFSHAAQAFRASWDTFKTGDANLIPGGRSKLNDIFGGGGGHTDQLTGENISQLRQARGLDPLDPNSSIYKMADSFGNLIRTPSRILMGTDEFVKQLNYRSHAYHLLLKRELEKPNMGLSNMDLAVRNAETEMEKLIVHHHAVSQDVLYRKHLEDLRTNHADRFASETDLKAEAKRLGDKDWKETSILRAIVDDGARAAEEATLQTPISTTGGAFEASAAHVQNMVNALPGLRIFMPFIRTPFNVVQWAHHRTADPMIGTLRRLLTSNDQLVAKSQLGELKNRYLKDILEPERVRADGGTAEEIMIAETKKQEAVGRYRAGVSTMLIATGLVMNNMITGAGPKDKEQRRLLQNTGWQPYSIKVGDSYVEYRRLDPFATILGTIADVFTISRYARPEDQNDLHNLSTSVALALANNVTNKTYMTGIRNLVDGVLSGDPNKMERVFQRYSASLVPTAVADADNFLAGGDPVMREVRSISDAMLNRMPYFGSLDPVRNFLGEPVRKISSVWSENTNGVTDLFLPLAYREVADDLVNKEIALLRHGFQPPRAKLGGVDFAEFRNEKGQSAYDRMLELRGEIKIGQKSLRRRLRELMRSRRYQQMDPISTHEGLSPRIAEINGVLGRYHRRAMAKMFQEFPAVRAEIDRVRRETTRRQGSPTLQSLR